MEQKQRQRFLEFIHIIFLPLHWHHHQLCAALGLGVVTVRPQLCPCKFWCCGPRAKASTTAEQIWKSIGNLAVVFDLEFAYITTETVAVLACAVAS